MRNLTLNVKKKWFDMILENIKKEEYREIKDFSVVRCLEMDTKLAIGWGGGYKTPVSAFNYLVGLCGTRLGAVKCLLGTCASFKEYDTVTFLNGMKKQTPTIIIECKGIELGTAKPEWSNNLKGELFKIKVGDIIETRNCAVA